MIATGLIFIKIKCLFCFVERFVSREETYIIMIYVTTPGVISRNKFMTMRIKKWGRERENNNKPKK